MPEPRDVKRKPALPTEETVQQIERLAEIGLAQDEVKKIRVMGASKLSAIHEQRQELGRQIKQFYAQHSASFFLMFDQINGLTIQKRGAQQAYCDAIKNMITDLEGVRSRHLGAFQPGTDMTLQLDAFVQKLTIAQEEELRDLEELDQQIHKFKQAYEERDSGLYTTLENEWLRTGDMMSVESLADMLVAQNTMTREHAAMLILMLKNRGNLEQ